MNSLSLNHRSQPYTVKPIALILLAIGAALSGSLFFYHQHLSNKTHLLKEEIQQMTQAENPHQLLQVNAKQNASNQAETKAVNIAITEISLPWPPLFKALEANNNEAVKLLSLEPNPKKGILRIAALALDTDSMMRYLGDLSQQKIFKDVTLVSQEAIQVNGKAVVRFLVETGWQR